MKQNFINGSAIATMTTATARNVLKLNILWI